MVDGAPTADPSEESTRPEELPDRLRVHSLARTLGTTSKRVLDALSELDGRIRSAHSTVDRDDAVRVRDLLASAQPPGGPEQAETAPTAGGAEVDEPESRLLLETPDSTSDRPHYMPLFVAPQPIDARADDAGTDDGADSDDSDSDSDADDDEQTDRPSNKRRRRGRRWVRPARLGRGQAGVVPRRVRLGGRMHPSRHAPYRLPGAQPHRLQHVLPESGV